MCKTMEEYKSKLNKEDIKTALEWCVYSKCVVEDGCPYQNKGRETWDCNEALMFDALCLIEDMIK